MNYVISEPEYKTSNWYKHIIDGLLEEKRKKRFSLTFLEHIEDIEQLNISDSDVVFVIGTNSDWILNTVLICAALFSEKIIVLGNHERPHGTKTYSVVSGDIENDIRALYSYLKSYGKNKIALYGINPDSTSDSLKMECFLASGGLKTDLFYNDSSLKNCYNSFISNGISYDGIICVNDYAAISFIKHNENKNLPFVTSCGGTMLSKFFSPSITQMETNYHSFGSAAFKLAKMLTDKSINSLDIRLCGKFTPGETTEFLPLKQEDILKAPIIFKNSDKFYADSEIDEMLKIETLFNTCSLDDLYLIEGVLKNMTYSDMSNMLFISENGIKYRLKNMFKICDVYSKKEFITMLKKYIKSETR